MCTYNGDDGPYDLLRKEKTHPTQMLLKRARRPEQRPQRLRVAQESLLRKRIMVQRADAFISVSDSTKRLEYIVKRTLGIIID